MTLFYWRKIHGARMLVCRRCEKQSGDPALASRFQIVLAREDLEPQAPVHQCALCGAAETLEIAL